MRKKRRKECIPNAKRVQAKKCFLKTKNGCKQKVKKQQSTGKIFSVQKHYKIFQRCQQISLLIPCNYCSYSRWRPQMEKQALQCHYTPSRGILCYFNSVTSIPCSRAAPWYSRRHILLALRPTSQKMSRLSLDS